MVKTTKVIFLDFDGVLNTGKYQRRLREKGEKWYDDYGPLFDPEAVANLRMVLDAVPDARLVISSTWKIDGLAFLRNLWEDRGMPGTIHGVTPDCASDLTDVDLSDPDNIAALAGKGGEVKAWLEENASKDCRYVIFDDTEYFFEDQMPHLVRTRPLDGILEEDARRAVRILTD